MGRIDRKLSGSASCRGPVKHRALCKSGDAAVRSGLVDSLVASHAQSGEIRIRARRSSHPSLGRVVRPAEGSAVEEDVDPDDFRIGTRGAIHYLRKRRLPRTQFCTPSRTARALIDDEAGDRTDGEGKEENVESGEKQLTMSSPSSSCKRQLSLPLAPLALSELCEVSATSSSVESAEHGPCRWQQIKKRRKMNNGEHKDDYFSINNCPLELEEPISDYGNIKSLLRKAERAKRVSRSGTAAATGGKGIDFRAGSRKHGTSSVSNSHSYGCGADERMSPRLDTKASRAADHFEFDSSTSFDNVREFTMKPFDSSEVLHKLETQIAARREVRICPKARSKGRLNGKRRILAHNDRTMRSVREPWRPDLCKLERTKPDFFANTQALLSDEAPISQGCAAYSALPMNDFNNWDLESIYRLEFDAKVRLGGSIHSWKQLLTVAGQLLRLCVVSRVCELDELNRNGSVFKAVCEIETVNLFIHFFESRGEASPVMCKAIHLAKLARHAVEYFSGNQSLTAKSNADRVRAKTTSLFNTFKNVVQRSSTRRRDLNQRIENGIVFFPQDIQESYGDALSQLKDIKSSVKERIERDGVKETSRELLVDTALVRKWFINLLLVLLFGAGGQRPQMYAQLQSPDPNELSNMKEVAKRCSFFDLQTLHEKADCSLDMPNVFCPASLLPILEFHISVMRPIVLTVPEVDGSSSDHRPILMHTRHGGYLTTSQISKVLKNYLATRRPHLCNATTMSLRSSYGTMMMRTFHDKEIFNGMDQKIFLMKLAQAMNTSPEQLLQTYVGIDRAEFEYTAAELTRFLEKKKFLSLASISSANQVLLT